MWPGKLKKSAVLAMHRAHILNGHEATKITLVATTQVPIVTGLSFS